MSIADQESHSHAPVTRNPTGWYAAIGLVILAGAMLRFWAAQGDLWLDEIWSYALSLQVKSAVGIFTQIHHDNNHHLMTLWMYLLGYQQQLIAFRVPSLLAGLATMVLSAVFARRWGLLSMFLAAVLTAGSYVLVIYSSEARGYLSLIHI